MEYQYRLDPATGKAQALFSLEHQIMGPWLEVEVYDDVDKIKTLLTAIDDIDKGKKNEVVISGKEYSVIIDQQDVSVRANSSVNGSAVLPDEYLEQGFEVDETQLAMCGLEDFRELVLSWSYFFKK